MRALVYAYPVDILRCLTPDNLAVVAVLPNPISSAVVASELGFVCQRY